MVDHRRFSERKAIRVIVVAALTCAAIIGGEWWLSVTGTAPALPSGNDLSSKFAINALALPVNADPTEYQEIAARTLFSKNRGKAPPVVAAASAPAAPTPAPLPPAPLDITLVAVILAPKMSIAVVQQGQGPDTQRLALGDNMAGWTLSGIYNDRVILQNGSIEQTVYLRDTTSIQGISGGLNDNIQGATPE